MMHSANSLQNCPICSTAAMTRSAFNRGSIRVAHRTILCAAQTLICWTLLMTSVEAQEQMATVADKRIDECSGLAASLRHPDSLWMHNDSGDKPRLFRVGTDGQTQAVCRIDNAKAVDWEDICSFDFRGESWLLIADVGDNQAKRKLGKSPCTLYLLREPQDRKISSVDYDVRIRFEYDNGPHNCEGVAVDVERQEILLLTKESPLSAAVYHLPLDLSDSKQELVAEQLIRLPIAFATGLDISADSRTLIAVTMWDGWVCHRQPEQDWDQALRNQLHHVMMPQRKQGESVCFSADGRFVYVNSEKKKQPLWRLNVDNLVPGTR